MKLNELFNGDINSIIQSFKVEHPEAIEAGCVRDQCGFTALEFENFAADRGFGMVERVQGYFKVDNPDFDNFTPKELKQLKQSGMTPEEFMLKNNLEDELKKIPHQWNEYRGQIIDFTGKAQFVDTGLASDLNSSRYHSE